MNKAKKWMVTLADEDYEWVKEVSDATDLRGSEVIKEAIALAQRDKEFKDNLRAAKSRIKLQELQERKASLEDEIRALQQEDRKQRVTA